MIITDRNDKSHCEFEELLAKTYKIIANEARSNTRYFTQRNAFEFEEDLFDSMRAAATGTDFDSTISLVSGHKFPDIVAGRYYGVEVKTSRGGHWKSVGNSVLESTRVEDVERIYLFFARLTDPVDFKCRLYQECLYDIAVTHSPRYLIDMELNSGSSIFDKIGLSYDELRIQDDPIKPIVNYYRSIAKRGEEPWWMTDDSSSEVIMRPTVTLWSNLSKEDQDSLRNTAFAYFPEIFGNNSSKYQNLASWLAARHGVVDSSLRDRFSAGGKVDLTVGNIHYSSLPKVFLHLHTNAAQIIKIVQSIDPDDAHRYWDLPFKPESEEQLLSEWIKKLIAYSERLLKDSEQFIVHLLGITFSEDDCPDIVRERREYYKV